MKALVIDDSRAMRAQIRITIKSCGFETLEASNGREALELITQEGPPDVALVDWNMPELNGLEFIHAARQRPDCQEMQILMVTTENEISRMAEALEAGANEYLMKPFTKDVLVQKLSSLGLAVG